MSVSGPTAPTVRTASGTLSAPTGRASTAFHTDESARTPSKASATYASESGSSLSASPVSQPLSAAAVRTRAAAASTRVIPSATAPRRPNAIRCRSAAGAERTVASGAEFGPRKCRVVAPVPSVRFSMNIPDHGGSPPGRKSTIRYEPAPPALGSHVCPTKLAIGPPW